MRNGRCQPCIRGWEISDATIHARDYSWAQQGSQFCGQAPTQAHHDLGSGGDKLYIYISIKQYYFDIYESDVELKVVTYSDHNYTNVNIATPEGIRHAVNMGLVPSHLADTLIVKQCQLLDMTTATTISTTTMMMTARCVFIISIIKTTER